MTTVRAPEARRPLIADPDARMVLAGRGAVATFCAGSVLAYVMTLRVLNPTEVDDAYMFLRYAKHYLAGAGFSWNATEGPVYGATSALYLLIVTALRGLTNLTDQAVLMGSSLVAGALACAALVALGFMVLDEGDVRRSWVPLLVVPGIVLGSPFRYHSLSGMETTVSLLCNSLLALSVVSWCRFPSRWLLAANVCTAYLAFLARPDNGIYGLFFPPLFLAASDRRFRRTALVYGLWFGGILLIDLLIKRAAFGDALPLPFFAKRAGFYAGYLGASQWNAVGFGLDFLQAGLPYLVAVACFANAKTASRLVAVFAPVASTFGYYFSVNQVMGYGARYFYPSLPYLILAAFVAVNGRQAGSASGNSRRSAIALRMIAVAALLLLTKTSPVGSVVTRLWEERVIGSPVKFEARTKYVVPAGTALPSADWWPNIVRATAFVKQLPPDTIVAASECGLLGAAVPDVQLFDLVGLHDRHIAHNGFSAGYLMAKNPDVLWLPHPDYSSMVKDILDSPEFMDRYEYYPGAFNYGLAIRKMSPRYATIKRVLEAQFAAIYAGRNPADFVGEPLRTSAIAPQRMSGDQPLAE